MIESRLQIFRGHPSPEAATLNRKRPLRRMWGLGNAPIPNMIPLLESKGFRVFSLAEEAREVDAFCTWHEGKPFVFLNTIKSVERSRAMGLTSAPPSCSTRILLSE